MARVWPRRLARALPPPRDGVQGTETIRAVPKIFSRSCLTAAVVATTFCGLTAKGLGKMAFIGFVAGMELAFLALVLWAGLAR